MTEIINSTSGQLVASEENLPPILDGHHSVAVQEKTQRFYLSVADMFEAWCQRSKNPNTQRAYRASVMAFIDHMEIPWPNQSWLLLQTKIEDVRNWRDYMEDELGRAPKTLNLRISSLSSFFSFMREVSADMRLPIVVPNPAHKDFIARPVTDPVTETPALSVAQARRLMRLPQGDSLIAHRDRAIIAFYLFSGARIATGCRLQVHDFLMDQMDPKIKVQEKGRGRAKRTIGLNIHAAETIQEYLEVAGIASGALFRRQLNPRSKKLGEAALGAKGMYELLLKYLRQLPGALYQYKDVDGQIQMRCRYTPHSLRATTITLLLAEGVDIRAAQELAGHKQVTTTQIYDKRRRQTVDSASHAIPI